VILDRANIGLTGTNTLAYFDDEEPSFWWKMSLITALDNALQLLFLITPCIYKLQLHLVITPAGYAW
jgi:hypothetical protein